MNDYTVPQLIELALDYALKAAIHDRAYSAGFKRGDTPARKLTRDAHFYARVWHDEAAVGAWRCMRFAVVPETQGAAGLAHARPGGLDALPDSAP